jgi:hypothetical protein
MDQRRSVVPSVRIGNEFHGVELVQMAALSKDGVRARPQLRHWMCSQQVLG